MTGDSGISFVTVTVRATDTILEVMGGGCSVLDYDGDGRLDLFFPGGGFFDGPDNKQIKGHPPKLYRNLGGLRFVDATDAAGLGALADGQPWFYSHGAAACDYDRDGWPDLLMTGYGRHALWHNEPDAGGGRRFREVTRAAGLAGPHSGPARPGAIWTATASRISTSATTSTGRTRPTRSAPATGPTFPATSAPRNSSGRTRMSSTATAEMGRSRT